MTEDEVLGLASMPGMSPSYPRPPKGYRFLRREYLIIAYKSNPAAIARILPAPLVPDESGLVLWECIRMPDSEGFGNYTESGIVIPAKFKDELVNYTAFMCLDDESPISGGREIWGFPKKFAKPKLKVKKDTLTAKVKYAGEVVAVGTMAYKIKDMIEHDPKHEQEIIHKMSKTQVNLKLIPSCDGVNWDVAQLVGYNLTELEIISAYSGPARLHLQPHVNAPVADLPVLEVVGGSHFIANLTLPYGRVLHNYLLNRGDAQEHGYHGA
jgi:acetoacetate decarboxylase